MHLLSDALPPVDPPLSENAFPSKGFDVMAVSNIHFNVIFSKMAEARGYALNLRKSDLQVEVGEPGKTLYVIGHGDFPESSSAGPLPDAFCPRVRWAKALIAAVSGASRGCLQSIFAGLLAQNEYEEIVQNEYLGADINIAFEGAADSGALHDYTVT